MKNGADATARGNDGYSPMHVAARRGNGKMVRMLLRYQVDASEMHADGITPFHRACLGAEVGSQRCGVCLSRRGRAAGFPDEGPVHAG